MSIFLFSFPLSFSFLIYYRSFSTRTFPIDFFHVFSLLVLQIIFSLLCHLRSSLTFYTLLSTESSSPFILHSVIHHCILPKPFFLKISYPTSSTLMLPPHGFFIFTFLPSCYNLSPHPFQFLSYRLEPFFNFRFSINQIFKSNYFTVSSLYIFFFLS